MIYLHKTQLIAKGRDRACYQHPTDPDLCIKVAIKPEKQSKRERSYLDYLHKKNRDLTNISLYQGKVDTNLGTGYLFDLIRVDNETVAPTLNSAIKNNLIEYEEVKRILSQLENYLYEQKICVYDLSPNNIAVQKNKMGEWDYKLIDGLGVANANPFVMRINYLTDVLLNRSFKRLNEKIDKIYKYKMLNLTPEPKKRQSKQIKIAKKVGLAITLLVSVFSAFYFEIITI